MPDPLPTQLNDRELELGTVDPTAFPYQKMRGLLGWISSAWTKITGRTVGPANAIDVAIVDASGNQITSFGSSTVTANQGTANTAANGWPVKITDGTDTALVSTGGALLVDGSATTQPVSATNLDIRDLTSASDSVSIGTSVVPGTGATHLGKAEDAGHTTGDTGVMALGVRNDGGDVRSSTNADYEPIPVASLGSLAGVPVHIMGDSIKYVQSNLADGSAVGVTTQDSILIAGSSATTTKQTISGATTTPGTTVNGLVVRQVGMTQAQAASDTIANPTATSLMGMNMVYNGSTWSRAKQASQTDNVAATGVPANAIYAVFDDTSPTAITENNFGALRMSSRKFLYTEGGEANDAAIASNPVRVAGRASTTAPTAVSAANDVRDTWVDLNGRQAVFGSYSFSNITLAAPTTTNVKSGAGVLHTLTINTPAANGVITIYDNTAASGTKIATITQPATLLSSGPVTLHYNAAFGTGLTIVTSGAAQDITVSYL